MRIVRRSDIYDKEDINNNIITNLVSAMLWYSYDYRKKEEWKNKQRNNGWYSNINEKGL